MLNVLVDSYNILNNIINSGAYASIELNKKKNINHKLLTKIVYGVLDENTKLNYFLSQLITKKPKKKIKIILKIGLYCILNLDSLPDYAIVDNTVKLTKIIGKRELSGFVNAVLKNAINYNFSYPQDRRKYLSVYYSKPIELVDYYINRYGIDRTEEIISVKPYELEHIRHNSSKINRKDFVNLLKDKAIKYIESKAKGFFVKNNEDIIKLFNEGILTFQSMTSMYTVQSLATEGKCKVLDLCAAPGGKSIYISELNPQADIISSDIHEHRLKLVDKYIKRMGITNISTKLNDACILKKEYINSFDYVLCDVPCSGLGLINKKPDIMLSKSMEDIVKLSQIQYNILMNAINYTKSNGVIVYSTCSVIKQENEDVINKVLENNNSIMLDSIKLFNKSMMNFLPDNFGQDGFFIARLRKK